MRNKKLFEISVDKNGEHHLTGSISGDELKNVISELIVVLANEYGVQPQNMAATIAMDVLVKSGGAK